MIGWGDPNLAATLAPRAVTAPVVMGVAEALGTALLLPLIWRLLAG